MFPEDRPAEEQREVRTVEEESLFRVAYPELVETYLRHKALAEENKTKSKTVIYDNHFKCTTVHIHRMKHFFVWMTLHIAKIFSLL